jgi:hypothetical protein
LRIVAVLAVGWTVLAPFASRAVTWDVPADMPTVAAGLAAAGPGDTVRVAAGTWTEQGLALPSGVTLRGAGASPQDVVLDAQGGGRILDAVRVHGVRVENVTLARGAAPAGAFFANAGGAIRCDSADVALADCVILDNSAAFGAGLAARGSSLSVLRCRFEADSASSGLWAAGGGMYVQGCAGVVAECVFERNTAFGASPPGDGGALFADESELVVTDCTFIANVAGAGAGALYSFFRDRTYLARCTFSGNGAPAGGALYVENSYPVVEDCTFDANAAANGGAVFLGERSAPRLEDCRFEGNAAIPFTGGGLDCWQSDAVLVRCTFAANSSGRGGALAAHGSSGLSLDRCFLDGNTASVAGGAVLLEDTASASMTRCTLTANGAPAGGAISAIESAGLEGEACLVALSTSGGAAHCTGGASVVLSCSDAWGNAGGDWTGCLAGQGESAGNFSGDPLLCAAGSASVTLPDSPCLPGGSPCGVAVGAGDAGCGCPSAATILVPADYPTIGAALAAAAPGDVVGVCSGEYAESIAVREGVHIAGVRSDLVLVSGSGSGPVLRAAHVADSTCVSGLTLDGGGVAPQVVLAESLTVGLVLARNVIVGALGWGVENGPDSRLVLGGSLANANDVHGHGGPVPRNLRNLNGSADSLDATRNFWGTQVFPDIVAAVAGKVRLCPITNAAHDAELCAPPQAVPVPVTGPAAPFLAVAPSPFSVSTRIAWSGPPARRVFLSIHDVGGRRVRSLFAGTADTGSLGVTWRGEDDAGHPVAPGVYFVRLEAGDLASTRKVVRLR